jgi:predicted RNA-binding Zn ribbon-like protein
LLPPSVVEEYAKADRTLRDYHAFFHENYVQRGLLSDAIAQTKSNLQRIEAATAETNKESAFREGEKVNLQADLAKFQAEVKAIADYEASLKQLLAQVATQLKATYLENRRAAESLTRAQLQAVEEINRRDSVAVQTPG